MKTTFLFLIVIYCLSCNEEAQEPGTTTPAADTPNQLSDTINKVFPDTGIYKISLSDSVTLSLQQWDSTIDLLPHLGQPKNQKIRQLDRNSDTFSGSFIKDVEYDGLKLKFFSPPQNGKTFWVQEIILTSNKYKTTTGITIGDEWEKVNRSYPSIRKFPGANDNMYYIADNGYEKSIEMEFVNNKLKKLRMYYMMN